ncbi:5498_t:CDS:1, partial [Racocetra persica]
KVPALVKKQISEKQSTSKSKILAKEQSKSLLNITSEMTTQEN